MRELDSKDNAKNTLLGLQVTAKDKVNCLEFTFLLADVAEAKCAVQIIENLIKIGNKLNQKIAITVIGLGFGAQNIIENMLKDLMHKIAYIKIQNLKGINCEHKDILGGKNREATFSKEEANIVLEKIGTFSETNIVFSGVAAKSQFQLIAKLKSCNTKIFCWFDGLELDESYMLMQHLPGLYKMIHELWVPASHIRSKIIELNVNQPEKLFITGHPDSENIKGQYQHAQQNPMLEAVLKDLGSMVSPVQRVCYIGSYGTRDSLSNSEYPENVAAFAHYVVKNKFSEVIIAQHPGQTKLDQEVNIIKDVFKNYNFDANILCINRTTRDMNTVKACAISGTIITAASTVATQLTVNIPKVPLSIVRSYKDKTPVPLIVALGDIQMIVVDEKGNGSVKKVKKLSYPEPMIINSSVNMAYLMYAKGLQIQRRCQKAWTRRLITLGLEPWIQPVSHTTAVMHRMKNVMQHRRRLCIINVNEAKILGRSTHNNDRTNSSEALSSRKKIRV